MSYLGAKEDHPKIKKILELRDKIGTEKAHEACIGMYKCGKLSDDKCLDGILAKLKALEDGKPAPKAAAAKKPAAKKPAAKKKVGGGKKKATKKKKTSK